MKFIIDIREILSVENLPENEDDLKLSCIFRFRNGQTFLKSLSLEEAKDLRAKLGNYFFESTYR